MTHVATSIDPSDCETLERYRKSFQPAKSRSEVLREMVKFVLYDRRADFTLKILARTADVVVGREGGEPYFEQVARENGSTYLRVRQEDAE